MLPKRIRFPWLLATLCVLPLAFAQPADAFTLGAADGTTAAAPYAAQMGARTYRLVMDPNIPLDAYAPRIEAYRAAGMRPQIVVGGTGTTVRGKTTTQKWRIINYAIHAQRRWPDAYSVSVVNEPNLSGISACQYARTFRAAYRMLKRAGAERVLLGEWAPTANPNPLGWTAAVMACTKGDVVADGWAWHCYDVDSDWFGIRRVGQITRALNRSRRDLHTRYGRALPTYCTEYGVPTRSSGNMGAVDANTAAARWARAIALVRKYRVEQIVAWGIIEAPSGSAWDTSTVAADGTPRKAFATIASAR